MSSFRNPLSISQPALPGATFGDCVEQMRHALAALPGETLPPVGQDARFADWVLKWKDVAVSCGDFPAVYLLTSYTGEVA
jgi:hypothetical protein